MNISKRISHSRPLATTAMHGRVEQLRAAGEEVIDFSIAISHFEAPESVFNAIGDLRQRVHPYTSVTGLNTVRSGLAAKVRRDNGILAEENEIVVTNGAKQALYEALYALTDPGDKVLIFNPHWPAYVATSRLLGLEPVLVDLPERITDTFLSGLPAVKLMIVNNPHNPTGKVFSAEEIDVLRQWMHRTGTGMIVDESYEKLIFEGEHISLAAAESWRDPGIVTIFSASQSYAMMGWRLGFAVAPAHVASAMEKLQGPITAAVSFMGQIAAVAAFDSDHATRMLEDYRQRRDMVVDLFRDVAWMRMSRPPSGPYLWGDVSELTKDTIGFTARLFEESRVAVMPGDALGVPGHIRIGYISDDIGTLRTGVAKIIAFGNAWTESMTA